MNREKFDALIQKLEAVSRRNPRLYLARIIGLVVLAYGYLGLVLVGSLALCVGIVAMIIFVPNVATVKLGLLGLVLFGSIFVVVAQGLWVKLEPPKGLDVTREQSPKLFAMLDELRAALKCQPFHRVLMVNDHNAGVVQTPRLGVFGWHRNYLLLGLPLMHGLAPEELKAVLAHEFAHSSGGHGRFGNWIYRVRRSWERIFEQMARERNAGAVVLVKFIQWFWPVFNAHAFVLARANEYEADACSVRLAGADAAANALLRLPIDGQFLSEKFWPDVFRAANHEQEPPQNAFITLGQKLRAGPAAEEGSRWLRQAFLIETNNWDTHPCLKDRLNAMGRLPPGLAQGEFPAGPPVPAMSAADFFLGDRVEFFARQMSEDWRKAVTPHWRNRHEQAKKISSELAALETPPEQQPAVETAWARAQKLIELQGDEGALAAIEQVLALDAGHAGANFVRGRMLLDKDEPEGVGLIEKAMVADPLLTKEGCNLLYGYYTRTGQRDKLRPLEDRVDRFGEETAEAQRERGNITSQNSFTSHLLTPQQVEALLKLFATEPEITAAAVAQKIVRHFPKSPCFVIALQIEVPWWKPRSTSANQAIVRRLLNQIQLPGCFMVFVVEQNLKPLGKKIFAVPGSEIYERPPKI